MEKILEKINEYYPQDESYNKELAKELCVLFNVSKSATIKSSGDFRDDDNRESQAEYYGIK